MMDLPFHLIFRSKHASVRLGVNDAAGAQTRSICLAVALEPRQDVQTADKRSLRSVQWTIELLDTEQFNEAATKEGAIGFLSYLPELKTEDNYSPESCAASVAVDKRTFNSLFDVLIAGCLPDWLSVSVKGMTYGGDSDYSPYGLKKIWDAQANRELPIVGISVLVPVAAAATSSTDKEEFSDEPRPVLLVTSADIRAISDRVIRAISVSLPEIVLPLYFLVAIAVAALLIVLFK